MLIPYEIRQRDRWLVASACPNGHGPSRRRKDFCRAVAHLPSGTEIARARYCFNAGRNIRATSSASIGSRGLAKSAFGSQKPRVSGLAYTFVHRVTTTPEQLRARRHAGTGIPTFARASALLHVRRMPDEANRSRADQALII